MNNREELYPQIWAMHLQRQSPTAISRELKIARSTIHSAIERMKQWGGPLPTAPMPGLHGATIQTSVGPDGAKVERIWYKCREDTEALEVLAQQLAQTVTPHKPITCTTKRVDTDLMGVYPIGDHHLGMYSWARETGEDWDSDKAVGVLKRAVEHHIGRMPKVGHYVLASLGDFMHSDFRTPVTEASGHALDADSRWRRCLDLTVEVFCYAIDRFAQVVPKVTVIMTPGNHDYHSANAAALILAAHYRNCPGITVRTEPKEHHAVVHGKVLNVFAHGHKVPINRIAGWVASEYRQVWGRTSWTYVHQGHIHKGKSGEVMSTSDESDRVKVEYHPILAARDAYAASNGWSSQRVAQQIIQHAEYGEVERHTVTARELLA